MKNITRNQAKSLNFASAYGMGDAKIQSLFKPILRHINNPIPGDKRTTRVIKKILKYKGHTSTGFSKRKTKKLKKLFKVSRVIRGRVILSSSILRDDCFKDLFLNSPNND